MTDYASSCKKTIMLLGLALVCAWQAPAIAQTDEQLAAATLVIYNANDPESLELANYYASRRNIPSNKLLGLDCPVKEEISRSVFETSIATPLVKKLTESGWWVFTESGGSKPIESKIRFLAIIRGVPLKVAADSKIPPATHLLNWPPQLSSRNDASVDSELAALGLPDFTPSGFMQNPYYRRFTPILRESIPSGLLLPSRLDAPTPELVKKMIDDSLQAEKDGLWGWGCVDARGITSGGLLEGDTWMLRLASLLRARGVPTFLDNEPATIDAGFPLPEVAAYFGWYAGDITGPFAANDFKFVPGAVAVHLHSFSASTLRSNTQGWCGPLIAHGAAATLGNVYEPYLTFTANLDIFQDRLMDGLTLAESAWMSQRAVSWVGVVVGDPLYRPYAAWSEFPKTQNPPNKWRTFRSISGSTKLQTAFLALHEAANETKDGMFLEALGLVQLDMQDSAAALDSFNGALAFTSSPSVRKRLEIQIANAQRRLATTKKPESDKEATEMAEAKIPGATNDKASQNATNEREKAKPDDAQDRRAQELSKRILVLEVDNQILQDENKRVTGKLENADKMIQTLKASLQKGAVQAEKTPAPESEVKQPAVPAAETNGLQESLNALKADIGLRDEKIKLLTAQLQEAKTANVSKSTPEKMEISMVVKPPVATPSPTPAAKLVVGDSDLGEVPQKTKPLADRAARLYQDKRYFDAVIIYRQAVDSEPNNLSMIANLAVAKIETGKFKDAQAGLEKVLAAKPNNIFALTNLGLVFVKQRNYEKAFKPLTQALQLDPNNAAAHRHMAVALGKLGKTTEAEEHFNRSISLEPNEPKVYVSRALMYLDTKPPLLDQARENYNKALSLDPTTDPVLELRLNGKQPQTPAPVAPATRS